jgi:predicted dehydrogenase
MLRVLVLGAGPAARRHVDAFAALPEGCTLTGVFDPDAAAAAELAQDTGLPVVDQLETALENADAAVVCGTLTQRPILARTALERGLDVLVEPPLAPTADMAHGLLSAIVRAPRRPVAMVAYDEQFDPTVRELRAMLADQALVSVETERQDPVVAGPLPEDDVVHGLMTQDLQFVLALSGEQIAATQAAGRRVRTSGPIDHAQALLVLEDDLVAHLSVSSAGGARVRRITVTTTHARVEACLDERIIEVVRTSDFTQGRRESIAQRVIVASYDATAKQAETFVRYCERRTSPEVGVGTAIAVQEAADAILKRVELVQHRPALRRGPQAA